MKSDRSVDLNLPLHRNLRGPIVVLGEVLWDLFPDLRRLGGAALNFAGNVRRLGREVYLLSAVGTDGLGIEAAREIAGLDLDTTFLQATSALPTGTAGVESLAGGKTSFAIRRPAAYDAIQISTRDIELLRHREPSWLYYGTLCASTLSGRAVLDRLREGLEDTIKFCDLNLRPRADSSGLVRHLLSSANVVKLNEEEMQRVREFTGLPLPIEAFCREGASRYGWNAVAVTLGERGCAILANDEYVEAPGFAVDVADTVGAGDAFAAAFVHGLSFKWPLAETASFANRVGALVASRRGAIPDWTIEEAMKL